MNWVRCLSFLILTGLSLPLGFAQSYNLESPYRTLQLPSILREISDITYIDPTTIACVQDELGILFEYDIKKNLIAQQDSFYAAGDYEGIAKVKKDVYILRGDGVLIEIKNAFGKTRMVKLIATNIPAADNEGLCYDKNNNRLFIASKSKSGTTDQFKGKRMIYAFNLKTQTLEPEALFEINIAEIRSFISSKYSLTDSAVSSIKFRPSAIAIHPLNGKLYLLSAAGYLLCVFNNGKLEDVIRLNPAIFNKAEGITFFKNGDMLISNEGQLKLATLHLFKCRKE